MIIKNRILILIMNLLNLSFIRNNNLKNVMVILFLSQSIVKTSRVLENYTK